MNLTTVQQRLPVGYKHSNLGPLPYEWEAVPLGELFKFKNGLNKAKRFFGTGTPIVNYMDVFERPGLRAEHLSGRVDLSPEEIRNFSVRLGDVFFTRTSETVEEIGVASVMLDEPCDTVFSGFVLRARPRNGRLNHCYKQYCFAPKFVRSQIVSNATYTTRALTNGRALSAVWIAVPPELEQRAIAEVLSDVDGLIGALDVLIAKKWTIKQAAMQQLLTGETRLPGFSGEWKMKQLGELIHLIPSGIYGLETQTGQLIGMPVATTAHIDLNDRWNEKQMNIRYFTEGQIEHYSPLEGDLIVVKSSGSAASIQSGKVGYVSAGKAQSFVFSNFLMLLRPIGCNAQFLFFQLTSGWVKQMLPQLVEASTYPNLRINDYLEVQIPLPPGEEQLAIVSILSDMDAEITALEQRREKTRAIKQGMMQQLLTGQIRLVESDAGPLKRLENQKFNCELRATIF